MAEYPMLCVDNALQVIVSSFFNKALTNDALATAYQKGRLANAIMCTNLIRLIAQSISTTAFSALGVASYKSDENDFKITTGALCLMSLITALLLYASTCCPPKCEQDLSSRLYDQSHLATGDDCQLRMIASPQGQMMVASYILWCLNKKAHPHELDMQRERTLHRAIASLQASLAINGAPLDHESDDDDSGQST